MEQERTELSTLGEFGLIERLTGNNETRQAGTIVSIGDDGAVIDHFGRQTVISSDMLVEGIHFDLSYTPLRYLGYKAVAVNLSDICAMMATPTQITLNIAVSNRFSLEALEEFYEGIYEACELYGVDLVGGDTTSSLKGFIISVTALGEVAPDRHVLRSGAGKGDLICVSGDLGAAFMGLKLLEREKKVLQETRHVPPDFENRKHIIRRLLKPEPRADIVQALQDAEIQPTAMIDISDGLGSELLHICRQSRCGCVVYENKVPVHEETKAVAAQFGLSSITCALSGGEDYELLFTVKQEDYEKVSALADVSVIGYITGEDEGAHLITTGNNRHAITAQGWNAFYGKQA